MPGIRFIYDGDKYDLDRELVICNVVNILSTLIELPESLEIQFLKLQNQVYGETTVDPRFKNRIRLQENLSLKNCILPTIHEAIHINQIFTGRLSGRRDGSYIWDKKVYPAYTAINHSAWQKLPWEIDVVERQPNLLKHVLEIGLSQL